MISTTLVGSGLRNRRHGLLFLEVRDKMGYRIREGLTTRAVCEEVSGGLVGFGDGLVQCQVEVKATQLGISVAAEAFSFSA